MTNKFPTDNVCGVRDKYEVWSWHPNYFSSRWFSLTHPNSWKCDGFSSIQTGEESEAGDRKVENVKKRKGNELVDYCAFLGEDDIQSKKRGFPAGNMVNGQKLKRFPNKPSKFATETPNKSLISF